MAEELITRNTIPMESNQNLFQCQVCHKEFSKKSKLDIHFRSHSGERPYSCSFVGCGKTFRRSDHLNRHLLSHTGERSFLCPYGDCGLRFSTSSHLKRHLNVHEKVPKFECTICTTMFMKKSLLRSHMFDIHGVAEFVCGLDGCTRHFSCQSKLNYHQKRHKSSLLRCSECHAIIRGRLGESIHWHRNTCKYFRCPEVVIPQDRSSNGHGVDFIENHSALLSRNTSVMNRNELNSSEDSGNDFDDDDDDVDGDVDGDDSDDVDCNMDSILESNFQFSNENSNSMKNMVINLADGHDVMSTLQSSVNDYSRLSKRKRVNDFEKASENDMIAVEGKFFNSSCDSDDLRHVEIAPDDFQCSICNKMFVHKKNLLSHIRAIHDNPWMFSCLICEQKFNYKHVLKRHQEVMHSKRKTSKSNHNAISINEEEDTSSTCSPPANTRNSNENNSNNNSHEEEFGGNSVKDREKMIVDKIIEVLSR